MSESGSKSNSWFSPFSSWELRFDRCLKISEAVIVLTITTALVLFVVREVLWVWFACDATIRQQRIEDTLKMLNENWKVGLLILVPLFYRTIRMFLERVRKAFGMEVQQPEQVEEKANPPEVAQAAQEPE
jgi:DNA integrity scanning protein DisA with diadenylate cyclase activity